MCLPPPPFHEDQMTLGYKSCVQSSHHERSIGFPLFFFLFFFFLNEPTIFPIYPYLYLNRKKKEEIWRGDRERNENLVQIFIRFFFFLNSLLRARILGLILVFIRFEPLNPLATIGKLTRAGEEGGGGDGFLGQRVPRMLENGKYRPLEGDF